MSACPVCGELVPAAENACPRCAPGQAKLDAPPSTEAPTADAPATEPAGGAVAPEAAPARPRASGARKRLERHFPPAPSEKATWTPFLALSSGLGLLFVVAFFIPLVKIGPDYVMSWDVLKQAATVPRQIQALLILPPVCGAFMLILGRPGVPSNVRGWFFAILACVGGAAITSLISDAFGWVPPIPLLEGRELDPKTFMTLGLASYGAYAVSLGGSRLRLHHPTSMLSRLLTGLPALGALALGVIAAHPLIGSHPATPVDGSLPRHLHHPSPAVHPSPLLLVILTVVAVAYGLGLLLSLVNVGPWREPEARGLALAALGCAAVVVAGTGLLFVLSFDVTSHLDMLGSILDAVLWCFGFPFLLGAGLSEVADGALEEAVGRRAIGAARLRPIAHMGPRARPGGTVEERLRELQRLLDQGLIQPGDYEQKKQSILDEV